MFFGNKGDSKIYALLFFNLIVLFESALLNEKERKYKMRNIKLIFDKYKKYYARLLRMNKMDETVSLFSDKEVSSRDDFSGIVIAKFKEATSPEALYVNHVNFVFSLLNKQEREIIYNDFIRCVPSSFWWMNVYSRSTYYRIRNKTYAKFLELFGEDFDI